MAKRPDQKLPRLIGLAGHAGAGKDTLGDQLVANHGFVKFSFSDALYGEVSAAFNVSPQFLYNRDTKELPDDLFKLNRCRDSDFRMLMERIGKSDTFQHSPREILQWWGTEYRRAQDPNYWLWRAQQFYEAQVRAGVPGLINVSVRFRNEAEWVKREGGFLVRITRPGVHGNGHISEKDVTGHLMDDCIANDGTPEVLYERFIAATTRAAYERAVPTGT